MEQKSPAIFSGGGHEFKSEIGLFRQLAGTQLFAARVQSGSQIELGENVQLRSIVRPGDGWNYSKLTDVIIQRYFVDEIFFKTLTTSCLEFTKESL